jgi:hypothetical protein
MFDRNKDENLPNIPSFRIVPAPDQDAVDVGVITITPDMIRLFPETPDLTFFAQPFATELSKIFIADIDLIQSGYEHALMHVATDFFEPAEAEYYSRLIFSHSFMEFKGKQVNTLSFANVSLINQMLSSSKRDFFVNILREYLRGLLNSLDDGILEIEYRAKSEYQPLQEAEYQPLLDLLRSLGKEMGWSLNDVEIKPWEIMQPQYLGLVIKAHGGIPLKFSTALRRQIAD